jgi:hypothetical protein
MVLDQVQVLDQQVAPARPVGEQRAHLLQSGEVDLAALGGASRAATAGPPNIADCTLIGNAHFSHLLLPVKSRSTVPLASPRLKSIDRQFLLLSSLRLVFSNHLGQIAFM